MDFGGSPIEDNAFTRTVMRSELACIQLSVTVKHSAVSHEERDKLCAKWWVTMHFTENCSASGKPSPSKAPLVHASGWRGEDSWSSEQKDECSSTKLEKKGERSQQLLLKRNIESPNVELNNTEVVMADSLYRRWTKARPSWKSN